MEKTLQVLAELVLASIPTVVLVLILFFYLRSVFFRPLEKVLAERDAATKGAMRDAEASLKRAEAKAAEYDAALRQARSEILKSQEAERQMLRVDRTAALATHRQNAAGLIAEAQRTIAQDVAAARQTLAAQTEQLASQITAAVLQGSRN